MAISYGNTVITSVFLGMIIWVKYNSNSWIKILVIAMINSVFTIFTHVGTHKILLEIEYCIINFLNIL